MPQSIKTNDVGLPEYSWLELVLGLKWLVFNNNCSAFGLDQGA